MRPPQERPTRQAVSSATPNSSIRGAPLAITSAASSTTAPSTQPPDTEPRKFPSPSMTRCEPIGRGAEPQVSTTVAIATSRPASRQDSAAARTSSSRVSIETSPFVLKRDITEFGVAPSQQACGQKCRRRKARSFKNGPAPVAPQDYNGKSIDRQDPRLWIVERIPTARQCLAKFGHAAEIVNWTK